MNIVNAFAAIIRTTAGVAWSPALSLSERGRGLPGGWDTVSLACAFLCLVLSPVLACHAETALVFQTDFGTKDGAVAAMKGVAFGVGPAVKQFDLTHEIPP